MAWPTISPESLIAKANSRYSGPSAGMRVFRSISTLSCQRKARELPVAGHDPPTACPLLLIHVGAVTTSAPRRPRSCMPVSFVHRNAWRLPSFVDNDPPTTSPRLLMPAATLTMEPPRFPRSVTEPSASQRTACGPSTSPFAVVFEHKPDVPT